MDAQGVAVVFFALIIMMAAAVAVLTLIYATRLPSARAARDRQAEAKASPTAAPAAAPADTPAATEGGTAADLAAPAAPAAPAEAGTPAGSPASSVTEAPMIETAVATAVVETPVAPSPVVEPVASAPSPAGETKAADATAAEAMPAERELPASPVWAAAPVVTDPPPAPAPVRLGRTPENESRTLPPPEPLAAPAVADTGAVAAVGQSKEEIVMSNDPKPVPESSKPPADKAKGTEKEKVSVGDFADLFAKSSSEDTKANKLAQDMPDVDVDDILREGRNLISRIKPK